MDDLAPRRQKLPARNVSGKSHLRYIFPGELSGQRDVSSGYPARCRPRPSRLCPEPRGFRNGRTSCLLSQTSPAQLVSGRDEETPLGTAQSSTSDGHSTGLRLKARFRLRGLALRELPRQQPEHRQVEIEASESSVSAACWLKEKLINQQKK